MKFYTALLLRNLLITKRTAGQSKEIGGTVCDHILINDPVPSRGVDR